MTDLEHATPIPDLMGEWLPVGSLWQPEERERLRRAMREIEACQRRALVAAMSEVLDCPP